METHRQERLVAALGHELRNPLAAALTGVSLVREMVDAGDPREPILSRAVADLERVGRLVASFLDFSRARGSHDRSPLDLVDVAQTVARRYGEVVRIVAHDPAPAAGDAALLERVVENLVENALGMGATAIEVRVSAGDGEACLDVRDNGPGVADDMRERLFEPSVSGRGSSGLGLAIAADVVAAHGGRITLRSSPPGSGAVFRVALPLAMAEVPLEGAVA